MSKNRTWIVWLVILALLVIGVAAIYIHGLYRVTVSYGEKTTLTREQTENPAYLEAWSKCSQLMAECEDSWKGKWPDYFGGMGVVENQGEYLINVYLTEDTQENRKAVCEAAGENLRAYTTTDISWSKLEGTLKQLDTVKSIPGVSILSMGINVEQRCVRVYLSHTSVLTTMALGLVSGPIEVTIVPVQPTVRSAVREEDGTVSITLSGLTYDTAYDIAISTDSAFEENVVIHSFEGNETEITLPDPGEGETWYVRAKGYRTVEDVTYQSEWSAAKTVKSA